MNLAEKLKAARLEAGLSQRQLCGDRITRNMLSQIENGAARPSMTTLGYLAQRLGKPISYFLEEQAVVSPNLERITQARAAYERRDYAQVLSALDAFQEPDAAFGEEKKLLAFLTLLALARHALSESRHPYAKKLSQQAGHIRGMYITKDLERSRQILLGMAGETAELNEDDALLLLAKQADSPERTLELLQAAENKETARWKLLRAEALFALGQYAEAATCYEKAEQTPAVFARLEVCYRELGDYKLAYEYACKQK